MEQNYYNEMDKLKNENEMEMRTVRAEMDRTLEISRQKEREFEIKTDEYQTEFKLKQKHMDRLSYNRYTFNYWGATRKVLNNNVLTLRVLHEVSPFYKMN